MLSALFGSGYRAERGLRHQNKITHEHAEGASARMGAATGRVGPAGVVLRTGLTATESSELKF